MWSWRRTRDLDTKTFLKSWQAYVVLVMAMGSMMFFGVCDPQSTSDWMPSGAAAEVDGVAIGTMEFRRAHLNLSNQLQQQYREQFDPVIMRVSSQALNGLVDKLALYLEASKNGVYASDAEIEALIVEGEYFKGEKGMFDPTLFERYLKSQGHTEKSFTEEIRRNLVTNKLRTLVSESYHPSARSLEIDYTLENTKVNIAFLKIDSASIPVKLSSEEVQNYLKNGGEAKVKEYFEKNPTEFRQDKKVRARHILITFKGARAATAEMSQRDKNQAKELAEKVLREVKAPGAVFAKLAEKYTDEESGKAKGGDLGYFRKEQMVKEFSEVAFQLPPGGVSSVVETPFGFHIIKVESVQDAKAVSLEQAKVDIANKLLTRERRPQLLADKVKQITAAVKAGTAEPLLSELRLTWQETGDFALNARMLPAGLGSDPALRNAILSLRNIGEMTPEPVKSGGSEYLLRLKQRTAADLSKWNPKAREKLGESTRFMEAFTVYNALSQSVRKSYENKNLIYRNPEFLDYDSRLKRGSDEG